MPSASWWRSSYTSSKRMHPRTRWTWDYCGTAWGSTPEPARRYGKQRAMPLWGYGSATP
jgi:hypothetical protein